MENFIKNQTMFSLISFVRSISYRAHLTIIFSVIKNESENLKETSNFENSSFQIESRYFLEVKFAQTTHSGIFCKFSFET